MPRATKSSVKPNEIHAFVRGVKARMDVAFHNTCLEICYQSFTDQRILQILQYLLDAKNSKETSIAAVESFKGALKCTVPWDPFREDVFSFILLDRKNFEVTADIKLSTGPSLNLLLESNNKFLGILNVTRHEDDRQSLIAKARDGLKEIARRVSGTGKKVPQFMLACVTFDNDLEELCDVSAFDEEEVRFLKPKDLIFFLELLLDEFDFTDNISRAICMAMKFHFQKILENPLEDIFNPELSLEDMEKEDMRQEFYREFRVRLALEEVYTQAEVEINEREILFCLINGEGFWIAVELDDELKTGIYLEDGYPYMAELIEACKTLTTDLEVRDNRLVFAPGTETIAEWKASAENVSRTLFERSAKTSLFTFQKRQAVMEYVEERSLLLTDFFYAFHDRCVRNEKRKDNGIQSN